MQLRTGITVVAAALLAACGGGGGGGSAPTISGSVVKGPVLGATVCAYAVAGGAKGAQLPVSATTSAGTVANGCFVTAADGRYDFALPAGTSGDVLLEATGGTFCSNEAQVSGGACAGGTLVDLGGAVMKVVTTAAGGNIASVHATPLTTAAVEAAGADISSANFGNQFTAIARQVLGADTTVTPTTEPTAATHPYLASLATYLAGGGSFQSAVDRIESGSTSFSGGGGAGSTVPATVHASLVGTRELQFSASSGAGCGSRCSYAEGQPVTVTVQSDGGLAIPGKVLRNPFHRDFGSGTPHMPEIIWLDAEANVEYALSDNTTGTFNEINVGDAAQPGPFGLPAFIGQLRAQSTTAGMAKLVSVAGSYAIGYQYRGADVAWTGITIGSDGGITFTGGAGPNVAAAAITEVVDRLGCCGRVDVQTTVDVDGDGTSDGNQISVYFDNAGAVRSIEYQSGMTSNTSDDVGVRLGFVTAITHDGSVPPAEPGVYGTFGGTVMNFSPLSFASVSSTGFSLEAANGAGTAPTWLLQVSGVTLQQGATYPCRVGPTGSVRINARATAGGTLRQSSSGGRCAITITSLTTSGATVTGLAGTFTAEFLDFRQDVTPVIVSNGTFRYVAP